MRAILAMITKDLRRRMRAPLGIGVVLSFPVVFSLMLAVTFGTGGNGPARIHLLVENHDDNFIGGMLMSSLTSDQVAENFDVEVVDEGGEHRLHKAGAAALLRIPAGFTDRVLEGKPAALQLVRNPAQGIMPEITEQLTGILAELLDAASRVLREPLVRLASAWEGDTFSMTDAMLTDTVLAVKDTLQGAGAFVFPPVILLDGEQLGASDDEDAGGGSGFGAIFLAILPGISVYALFLVGDLGMRDLLTEAEAGTLRRQLCGPQRAGTLILGKALSTMALCVISVLLLTVIGALIAPQRVSPAGFVLLSLALILAVTGMASTIYGTSRSESRGSTIGAIIYLILAFAGGSFITFEALPAALRTVAPVSPFYWGTIGFRTLLRDGGGPADILLPAVILAGLGAATLLLGSLLLQRQARRGMAG
jgi:ABC-2 type transport system permease protein